MDFVVKHNVWMDLYYAIESTTNGLRSYQEPDYIASLVTNLPNDLSSILRRHVPHMRFKVGGCFIHQKPIVRFTSPQYAKYKKPELGDLLIVYKETKNNTDRYNALLLQAKKTNDVYYTPIHHNDQHQYLLYTKWPKFEYHRAGTLNGRVRSISPKTISSGAQYLLIDEHHNAYPPSTFWCACAAQPLNASNTLATALLQLIEFQTGRTFVAKGGNIDQWSKMIWDLLTVSSESVFNRRPSGFHKCPRSSNKIFQFLSTLNNEEVVQIIDTGISTICIEGQYIEEGEDGIEHQ